MAPLAALLIFSAVLGSGAGARAAGSSEKPTIRFDGKSAGAVQIKSAARTVAVPRSLLLGHLFSALRLYDWHFDNKSEALRFATFPNSKKLTIATAVERRFDTQFVRLKSTVAFFKRRQKPPARERAKNLALIEAKVAKLNASYEAGAAIRPINDALFSLLQEFLKGETKIEPDDSSVALILQSYLRETPDLGFVKSDPGKPEFMKAGVTQQQWFDVMGFNPSFFARKENCPEDFKTQNGIALCPNLPLETMSIHQLDVFQEKVRFQNSGFDVALPSLEERNPMTGTITEAAGWFAENSDMQTHPAGSKPANDRGLFDMAGNLWEVLRDEAAASRIRRLDPSRPANPRPEGKFKIAGGSWIDRVESVRKKTTSELPDSWTCYDVGFRLVRRPKP